MSIDNKSDQSQRKSHAEVAWIDILPISNSSIKKILKIRKNKFKPRTKKLYKYKISKRNIINFIVNLNNLYMKLTQVILKVIDADSKKLAKQNIKRFVKLLKSEEPRKEY